MRIVLTLICLACAGAASALETARGLAASGAPQLALARVEQLQPREAGAPGWTEWEALRLTLLVDLKRNDEVLRRAAALPAGMPQPALRQCLLAAARAAVAAGQGAAARAYAARLLWQLDATAGEARGARLIVIESYALERQGESAFRAMLRFDQDYRPLGRDVTERFVERLLDLGLEKEAVNWLAGLDDASALKLRLRFRTGLVTPDAAIAQARVQLAKTGTAAGKADGGADYWQMLAEVAEKHGNGVLRIEALERLLHLSNGVDAQRRRALTGRLWQAYATEAQAAASQGTVLSGDDAAWLDHAARRLGTNPQQSRSLFSYLLTRSGAPRETRFSAQLQLAFSLYQDGLDQTALVLFSDERAGPDGLDPQARYLLGSIAEAHNAPASALRFWQGLATPPGVGAEEWQVRLAVMQWRAGEVEAAANTMRALVKPVKSLPGPASSRALALAREMLDAGKPGPAEELYAALLPLAGRGDARDILLALGGIAESAARHARAADYFLRAALVDESRATDALALQARLAAAMNLARAGYRDDALAQIQWLLKHSKDPAQIEAARRALSRM
jgi:hypothetical protein